MSRFGFVALIAASLMAAGSSLFAGGTPNQLSEAESRSGWKLLFDGKSGDSWRNYKKDGISDGWEIADGALSRTKGGAGDIISKDQFEAFELQLEYRISKGGNSGVMFHVTEEAQRPWQTGPEIQVQDNVDGHDPQKAGWLYQLYQPKKPAWAIRFESQVGYKGIDMDDATRPAGEWNHLYIRIHPKQSEVCMNGVHYYYFVKGSDDWNERVAKSKFAKMPLFGKATKGHICLQDHGNLVSYRSIKVRELPADGRPKEPIDGVAKAKFVPAFPNVEWEGWAPFNDDGKQNPPLRTIHLTHAGDGSGRVFAVDQSGMIHVLKNDDSVTAAKMFIDLRSKTHQFKVDDEEGLLGFAFHPNYKENGHFFIYYNPEGKPRGVRLSRFTVSKNDPNKADIDSEKVLWEFTQPFSNHNGGPMTFGNDGLLYLGLGDGGGRNDPEGEGQNLKSVLGCVLRFDVDHQDAGKAYAVPKDNPFVGKDGIPPEIYAYGIRNPWRFSCDKVTGELWLADVGQDIWEEVDLIKKGGNYGWSIREALLPFGSTVANDVETVDPIWEYDHRIGKSITGGHVYRGSKVAELAGHYLYGDYVAGRIYALNYDVKAGNVVRNVSIPWSGLPVLAFGDSEDGESFVTTPSAAGKGIYRLVTE